MLEKKPRRRQSLKRKLNGVSLKEENQNEIEEMKLGYTDVGLMLSMAVIYPKSIGGYDGDKILRACVRQIASDCWKLNLQGNRGEKRDINITLSENIDWPGKLKEEKKKERWTST